MALITRLARLWRSDINAKLDSQDAPDLVLAQAVREMEQAIDTDRRAHSRIRAEIERLDARAGTCAEALAQAETALEDCLAEDRDDLARPLIRRRLETEREVRQLERRRTGLASESEHLAQRIAERQSSLLELRSRAALYAEAEAEPQPAEPVPTPAPIRDDEVEIQLLQAKRRRGGAA